MPESAKLSSPNGATAAALVATGLGCATLAVATTRVEASPDTADALNWWPPVGPLAEKAGTAAGVFFASWLGLHLMWRRRRIPLLPIAITSALLLGVEIAGTFPPFIQRAVQRGGEGCTGRAFGHRQMDRVAMRRGRCCVRG